MPDPSLSTDPVPETRPITEVPVDGLDPEITLQQFLNEQRAMIASEVQADMRSLTYLGSEINRKQAILTMIDEHLAELAQPVEPGQEVQS